MLQLECKVNGDGLNSGIFFRTLREGRWAGYESQINNVFKDGDRTKPADFGTGGIYRRQPARRVVADDHEWFTKTIVADGPHMAVWVNGYQVSDWTDDAAGEGKRPRRRRDWAGRRSPFRGTIRRRTFCFATSARRSCRGEVHAMQDAAARPNRWQRCRLVSGARRTTMVATCLCNDWWLRACV